MKHLLLINAHQFYEHISAGRLNRTMLGVLKEEMEKYDYEVRQTDIESGYNIDVEVQNHDWADIVILQTPVYWFGAPWIYKKYVDEVFTAAMMQGRFITGDGRTRHDPSKQYGTGGLMQGKKYMLSLTWNAPKDAFGDKDQVLFAGKTADDVFVANTANYKFCGAEVLPSFSCHDVMKAPVTEDDIARLREHLAKTIGQDK